MSTGNKSYKGIFKATNPKKYKGDANNIVYRSSWEVRVMKWLDLHPDVLWWASEELMIPYYSQVDHKMHRYFPDFIVKMRKRDGMVMTYVLEVKPEHQTRPPTQKKKTKRYLEEAATYVVNQCKWKAADEFCHEHGWQFKVVTEKDLGI